MTAAVLRKDGQRGTLYIRLTVSHDGAVIQESWRDTGKAPRKSTTRYVPNGDGQTPDELLAELVKRHLADGYTPTQLPESVPLIWLTFSAELDPANKGALMDRVGLHWLCTDITSDPSVFPTEVGGFPVAHSTMSSSVTAQASAEGSDYWSDVQLQRLATFFVMVDSDAKLVRGDETMDLLRAVVSPGVRSGKWDPMLESVLVQLGICSAPVKFTAPPLASGFTVCI